MSDAFLRYAGFCAPIPECEDRSEVAGQRGAGVKGKQFLILRWGHLFLLPDSALPLSLQAFPALGTPGLMQPFLVPVWVCEEEVIVSAPADGRARGELLSEWLSLEGFSTVVPGSCLFTWNPHGLSPPL